MRISVSGREFDVTHEGDRVTVDGKQYGIAVRWDDKVPIITVEGLPFRVELPDQRGGEMTVVVDYRPVDIAVAGAPRSSRPAAAKSPSRAPVAPARAGAITATMTGEIVEVHVSSGDRVVPGAVLAILEAMKMRNEVTAPVAGIVETVEVQPGSRVNQGDVLVVLRSEEE